MKGLVSTALWLCLLIYSGQSSAKWFEDKQGIMGTNIHVELWSDSAQQGEAAIQAVMDEMQRINQLMSPYIESSELSKLNHQASAGFVPVSKELFELIALSVELAKETDGAFDITFASVGYLYNYRESQKPQQSQIAALLKAINYRHIRFNLTEQSVFFAHPNVKIDLGGIAKGHAVDNAIEILKKRGIKHALVTAGGDTKLLGDRLGKPWMVGIRDPRDKDKQAVVLPLADTALSTSGDYERYFEQDGKRYHHILSPKTGTSAKEVQSVSIIGQRSTLNDALSTAVFVLGVQKGMDLLNRTPGYDGIIVDNQRKLHYSNALVQ
ncbi:FAD:protein FMN transferase [Paraglaciecola arctica]|uniref:FAD:protein FMN transferase n=1 Tax=Paraglaciecola arctica BSs20135 TaxID=493475 RepID=K6YZF0_9ALTE|nr:thiamine biosynthesis lipoprotein [Paraglaciecola arctica BSs20135]